MSSATDNVRKTQLVLELTQAEMDLITAAAEQSNRSLNDFAVSWLRDAALEVIDSQPGARLTLQDTLAVLEAMENPPVPSDDLRQAFRDYETFVREQS